VKTYESFLRITPSNLAVEAPCADAAFLQSKGIYSCAPDVLHAMRYNVMPLITRMKPFWYCFLVHDRASGVPTKAGDTNLYIHLRAQFESKKKIKFPSSWEMTREIELPKEIAGVDMRVMPPKMAWDLLHLQSELFLHILAFNRPGSDPFTVLKHTRQFLHFFANMAQMRVE
jgi:hypothetical protein